MPRLLKIIYVLSISPLFIGSVIFFYWHYKRVWFAESINIELAGLFTFIGFVFSVFIVLILSVVFVNEQLKGWKKIILPFLIIVLTFPVVQLYGTIHTAFLEKAFVRIVNDTDRQVERIWSENFEITYFENKDFIISFYPVYKYDWMHEKYSSMPQYEINSVYIDLKQKEGSVVTYRLPIIDKGSCKLVKLTDLVKEAKYKSRK